MLPAAALPRRWVPVAALRPAMSPAWWQWIASTDSLTARLIAASPAPFRVCLVHQAIERPLADEALALGESPARVAWVREVALMSGSRTWVSARSVAPLTPACRRVLRALGERSLGSWLFAQSDLERDPIEALRPSTTGVWLRRSRFRHTGLQLLVQERFDAAMAADLGLPPR
nr:chorismate lyase [Salinicola sp. S1-1-2]